MESILGCVCFVLVLAALSSAQNAGDLCTNATKAPSQDGCKYYLECSGGFFVNRSCGRWKKFDVDRGECRWSPLAKCLPSEDDQTPSNILTCRRANNSDKCRPWSFVPVVNYCQYFCACQQDGTYSEPRPCYFNRYFDSSTARCVEDRQVCSATPSQPVAGSSCEGLDVTGPTASLSNCHYYFQCDNGTTWTLNKCKTGEYFNDTAKQCRYNYKVKATWPFFSRPCDME